MGYLPEETLPVLVKIRPESAAILAGAWRRSVIACADVKLSVAYRARLAAFSVVAPARAGMMGLCPF